DVRRGEGGAGGLAGRRMTGPILLVPANPSVARLYALERLAGRGLQRPELVVVVPGGKGLNAARAAARLGGRVTAVGIVGGRDGERVPDRIASPRHTRRV